MNWEDLTLWQYQQLVPIITKPDPEWTELDVDVKKLVIITGLTEQQIDSLPIDELKALRKQLGFLDNDIPQKALPKYIETNGKRYKIVYDVKKMPAARYIESKVFSKDNVANLHKIAASMVMPQVKNWYGAWVTAKYDASDHEVYANDLALAKFVDIYSPLVFFYQVYRNWIEVSRDYMIQEMMTKGLNQTQAEQVVETLCQSMDGTIPANLLPSWKISHLSKYLK